MTMMRKARSDGSVVLTACNFTPVPRFNYRIGVPHPCFWGEVLNSDAGEYWGSGLGNRGGVNSEPVYQHGRPYSMSITLPPLSRFALIGGKMIPYALITTLDFIMVAALGRLIFDLPLRGSLPVVLGLGVGFVLSLLALGSLISAVSDRQIQAHFTNVFYFTLCILLFDAATYLLREKGRFCMIYHPSRLSELMDMFKKRGLGPRGYDLCILMYRLRRRWFYWRQRKEGDLV